MANQNKVTPSFYGEDADAVQVLTEQLRKSTKVPTLSVAQAVMIAVREKLEITRG